MLRVKATLVEASPGNVATAMPAMAWQIFLHEMGAKPLRPYTFLMFRFCKPGQARACRRGAAWQESPPLAHPHPR